MNEGERRAEARSLVLLRVDYPNLDGFLQDYTANISHGGTMICTRRDVLEGQELELAVSFPGLLEPILLLGQVRWVRDESHGERAFGIEFHRDETSGWSKLAALVERIVARDQSLVADRTLRVLVVEDNLHIAHLVCQGLETQLPRVAPGVAYSVEHAPDGAEALARLEAATYDVLLLDVVIPALDGLTLIARLRAAEHWHSLPIVAFSGAGGDMRERALGAGADFFLSKPLRLQDLLQTIAKLSLLGRERESR